MVGQVQRFDAVSERVRRATGERAGAQEPDQQSSKRSRTKSANPLPPPLALNEAEADLCERLTGLLSKAPRRGCDEAPMARVEYSDRIATVAEVVPEPAALPPLPVLPELDLGASAPAMSSIKWVKGARRERLKSAVGYSAAWLITLAVIAVTVAGATVLTLGAEKSSDLAAKASQHGAQAASTAVATLRSLIGQ